MINQLRALEAESKEKGLVVIRLNGIFDLLSVMNE